MLNKLRNKLKTKQSKQTMIKQTNKNIGIIKVKEAHREYKKNKWIIVKIKKKWIDNRKNIVFRLVF